MGLVLLVGALWAFVGAHHAESLPCRPGSMLYASCPPAEVLPND